MSVAIRTIKFSDAVTATINADVTTDAIKNESGKAIAIQMVTTGDESLEARMYYSESLDGVNYAKSVNSSLLIRGNDNFIWKIHMPSPFIKVYLKYDAGDDTGIIKGFITKI